MSRDVYVEKKQFDYRKLKLRQEYERGLAVSGSDEKEVDADFDLIEQVQRALKHLGKTIMVLSTHSTNHSLVQSP